MHLGLIDGPFVPHNLISAQESLFLYQSSRWLPVLNLNGLWVQLRNPDILFFYSQKSRQTNPSRFPDQGPCNKRGLPTGLLHISQKPHLSGSPIKGPFLGPLVESLTKRYSTTRVLLHSSVKVAGIRAPPSRVPHAAEGPPQR